MYLSKNIYEFAFAMQWCLNTMIFFKFYFIYVLLLRGMQSLNQANLT